MRRLFLAAVLAVAGCVPMPDVIDLQFPYGGLVRNVGYQQQAPYTTPDCNNVRPRDASTGRRRGGSRPMLDKAYLTELSGGDPIRLLASVRTSGTSRVFSEPFLGSELSSAWTQSAGPDVVIANGNLQTEISAAGAATAAVVSRAVPSNFDSATGVWAFEADVRFLNREAVVYGFTFNDDSNPAHRSRLEIFQSNVYLTNSQLALYLYVDGALEDQDLAYVDPVPNTNGTFRVEVDTASGDVSVFFRGVEVLSAPGTFVGAPPPYAGTTLTLAALTGYRSNPAYGHVGYVNAAIDEVRLLYDAADSVDTARLVAIAGPGAAPEDGTMYIESSDGSMGTVTQTESPDSSDLLQAATHLGKLYIVNNSIPLVFDAGTEILNTWSKSAGTIDLATMKIICEWNGRIVVGDGTSVYYMSRQGDPTDFDFGAVDTDLGRAVAGTSSDTDQLGQPIVAYAPLSRDYLAMGCASSLWLMAGDPAAGGTFSNLSRTIGIIGPSAWCVTPDGLLVFLSSFGVYVASPGSSPVAVSKYSLPRELFNVDPSSYFIQMAYDVHEEGVVIFLTPKSGGSTTQWFIDWQDRTFWPSTYNEDHQPTAVYSYDTFMGSGSRVMLGGGDGYIRRHTTVAGSDDGEEVNSYVYCGPVRLGSLLQEGSVDMLQAVLGENSNPVGWQIRVGDTGETSLDREVIASGTWGAGRNPPDRPRVRAASANLKLFSTKYWTLEEMVMARSTRGLIRQ